MADQAQRTTKPDGPGGAPGGLDEHIADIEDRLSRYEAAGLIGAPEQAEIEGANSWLDQAREFGNAALAAAACIARGLF
jgi:hypothetical protein